MKIIKPGKLPELQLITTTCKHCGCMFECTLNELVRESDRYRDYYKIHCPTCLSIVYYYPKG